MQDETVEIKKRAKRRGDNVKKKGQTRRVLERWRRRDVTDEMVGLYYNNITVCSCVMCGNPRRHFGKKTRQEEKADVSESEVLSEIGNR